MRPDDDDEADVEGGPPPDPSTRQWRHPSEIAAASAAAARPLEQPSSRRSGPVALTLAVTAAASLLVGVGTVLVSTFVDATGSTGSFSLRDDSEDDTTGATAATESPLVAASMSTAATSTTDVTNRTRTSAPGGERPAVLQPRHSTSSAPSSTLVVEEATPVEIGPDSPDGLYTPSEDDRRRLAAFVMVDGMVFTSASAIAGHDELALLVDGEWAPATVLGQDPKNDVAVLELNGHDWNHLLYHYDSPWPTTRPDHAPEPGTRITIVGGDGEPIEGFVIDPERRVVATTGDSIYGAVLTSAPRPSGASGAAIVDDNGSLLGLVVDTTDYLASVVPLGTILDIGRAVHDWGIPAVEWLGIKGSSMPDGGVEVSEVTPGGPAAEADLMPGDAIVRVDDISVIDWDHLVYLIRRSGAGSTIDVVVRRDTTYRFVETVVGSKYDWSDEVAPAADVATADEAAAATE